MKSTLNVAVMQHPGSDGDDINWVQYMILGHDNPDMVTSMGLDDLADEFWTEELRYRWYNDRDALHAEHDDLVDIFLEKADELGYTVFNPVQIHWIPAPKPLPLITT